MLCVYKWLPWLSLEAVLVLGVLRAGPVRSMDVKRPDQEAEASELGAAEAVSPGAFGRSEPGEPPKEQVICPFCDRPVEPGFKFCDWCGKPLAKPPSSEEKPVEPRKEEKLGDAPPAAPKRRRRFSLRGRRAAELLAEGEARTAPAAAPKPVAPPAVPQPRAEPVPPPRTEPIPAARVEPAPPPRPAVPRPPAAIPPPPPPTVTQPKRRRGISLGRAVLYLVHLIVAFGAGALVLATVAVIVALVSEGERTFLEMRGLPVFVGVAVSVGVFAVFRGTAPGAGTGRGARIAAAAGLVVLVGAGVYLYRPTLLVEAQPALERLAGVWTDQDEQGVEAFRSDLVTWTSTIEEYQRVLAAVVRNEITVEEFRGVATEAENSLEDAIESMDRNATSTTNEKLRTALSELADAYEAQVAALKQVSRGILQSDFQALQGGDTAYKQARNAARDRFERRVRPLLERAGFDEEAFERAIDESLAS